MPKRSAGVRPTQPSPLSPSLRCLQILEAREAYIGFSRSSLQCQYTIINKANSRGSYHWKEILSTTRNLMFDLFF
ncbi:unnamed protein product [Musa hybrid cultivar]